MEITELLLDGIVSDNLQCTIDKAIEVYNKSLEKYPQIPVKYTLHYSYPIGGREIPQNLLETLYVFRNKLKSIKPLPPQEMFYIKVVRRLERQVFIDMSIYDALLNSMRGIIFNKDDSIFYKKVINDYKRAISGNNTEWDIEALDGVEGCNINAVIVRSYTQTQRLISSILKDEDFAYVYNGVLQHSDKKHWDRYIKENESNSIMYVTFKCAILANQIRNILLSDTVVFDEIIKNNKQYLIKR